MAFEIRRADYYFTTIQNAPGEGHKIFSELAGQGVNLLAITAVPIGPTRTQLTLFPEDAGLFQTAGKRAGLTIDGPHPAILVDGDDHVGVMAGILERLQRSNVDVYATHVISEGEGRFGCVLYVRRDDIDRAMAALEP